MRKHKNILTRTVAMLFLLAGSVSAWAFDAGLNQSSPTKQHCAEHAGHNAGHQQADSDQQHDCCKSTNTCNKLCCNSCMASGMTALALLPSINLQLTYLATEYPYTGISLPDGTLSSTPYRPPQSLLI